MFATARSITLCILLTATIAACGSSPPVQYYALSTAGGVGSTAQDGAATLGLGPLRMPEYLNRTQFVTRTSGTEMQVDEFNRWAEPLSPSMHRIVAANVDRLRDDLTVIAFPHDAVIRNIVDYRLHGDIVRFDADNSGHVVLEVQWAVTSVDGEPEALILPHRNRYETQASRAGDPAAVVAAMNNALSLFSQDIADEMAPILQD